MLVLMLSFLSVTFSQNANAAYVTNISEIGPHYTLVEVDKNENPQNIMMIYTKLDASCSFVLDDQNDNQPFFDFYWLMDGTQYKPVNSQIVSAIRDNFVLDPQSVTATSYSVKLNDLSQLDQDIANPQLLVKAVKKPSGCDAASFITLGPSDGSVTIQVTSIYTEAHFSLTNPPSFQALDAVTLNGTDVRTGKKISHRYTAN